MKHKEVNKLFDDLVSETDSFSGQHSLLPSLTWEWVVAYGYKVKAKCGWLGWWYVCCLRCRSSCSL